MRIGIVAPSSSPANGIGIYANSMADALCDFADVETFWVVSDDAPATEKSIRKNHLPDYIKVAAAINNCCDVCVLHHGFSAYGWRNGGLVSALAQWVKIPLVVIFHEVEHHASENRRIIGQALAARANQVVVMSQQAANIAEHLFKIGADKIKILHYGTPTFKPMGRVEAKKLLGFGNRPVVLSFGLLKPSGNLEKVLDAVSSLINKFPDLLFVHVGQSDSSDGNSYGYRKSLLIVAQQFGLNDNVCFVDRFVPNNEWVNYLQCADLCIVGQADASKTQCAGLPMAMSAGLAVISSPFLYANEVLGDKMGEIVPFDDPRLLAAKILNLMGSPKQLQLYRQAAGDFGAQFAWDKMVPKYLALLNGLQPFERDVNAFALMNDAQLLLPIQSINRKPIDIGNEVDPFSWRILANLSHALNVNNGDAKSCNADIYLFVEHMAQLSEPLPMGYYAMGHWLSQNTGHALFGGVQTLFKSWTKMFATESNLTINQLSLLALGLCEYIKLLPYETQYLPLLRKWQKAIGQWFVVDGSPHSQWPEEKFSGFPELTVLALHESSALLMLEDDKAFAGAKASFIIERLFVDRFYMPLSGRSYPLTKVKRNEFVQWAEEAYWAIRLFSAMAKSNNDSLMMDNVWQTYLWFLGDNNVRKSLIGFQTGSCASHLIGTEVIGIGKSVGDELFVAVLGHAYDAYIHRVNTSKNRAFL